MAAVAFLNILVLNLLLSREIKRPRKVIYFSSKVNIYLIFQLLVFSSSKKSLRSSIDPPQRTRILLMYLSHSATWLRYIDEQ